MPLAKKGLEILIGIFEIITADPAVIAQIRKASLTVLVVIILSYLFFNGINHLVMRLRKSIKPKSKIVKKIFKIAKESLECLKIIWIVLVSVIYTLVFVVITVTISMKII